MQVPTAFAASPPLLTVPSTTVTGVVTVNAAGDVDPGDTAQQMVLLVDGSPVGSGAACAAVGSYDCAVALSWDSTGVNGPHVLSAELVSAMVPSGTLSAPVPVSAVNPPPTVAITAPVPGAVATSALTVGISGSVDAAQTDAPVSLQLVVDGAKYGAPRTCSTGSTCVASVTVPVGTWSGPHTVAATLVTRLTTVTSAAVPFLVHTATTVSLSPVGHVVAGHAAVIRGQVVAVNTGALVARTPLTVTLVPAVGAKKILHVMTGSTGHFTVLAKLSANSTVTVTSPSAAALGGSHRSVKVGVLAPISCTADRTIRHGNDGTGTCTVARLPKGTTVSLQYLSGKKWKVLGSGRAAGPTVPISFTFAHPGTYQVRLVLGATKVYLATNGKPFPVKAS